MDAFCVMQMQLLLPLASTRGLSIYWHEASPWLVLALWGVPCQYYGDDGRWPLLGCCCCCTLPAQKERGASARPPLLRPVNIGKAIKLSTFFTTLSSSWTDEARRVKKAFCFREKHQFTSQGLKWVSGTSPMKAKNLRPSSFGLVQIKKCVYSPENRGKEGSKLGIPRHKAVFTTPAAC